MSRFRNDPRGTLSRFLPLVLVLAVVGVAAGASSFLLLYRAEVEAEASWLQEIARSQARFIKAVAAFDAEFSREDDPGGGFGATLRQARVAQERFGGWGKEGHLHLVALEGDTLVSLLGHRAEGSDAGSLDGHPAAMMATMELAEIRSPFVRVALMVGLVTLSLSLGGGLVIRRLTEPTRRRLLESERRYRQLFEDSGEAILLLTADGTILEANGAAEAMAGERGRTLVGRNALDFHPDPGEMSALLDLLRREGRVRGRELRFRREDGSELTCLATIHLRMGEGAEPDRLETLLTDITEQKRVEAELRESETRYFDLFEHAPDMLLSADPATAEIRACNSTLVRLTGFDRQEIVGRSLLDLCRPGSLEAAREALELLRATGAAENVELELRRRDGSAFPVSMNAVGIFDAGGGMVASRLSMRDVSQQRELSERLDRILAGTQDGLWDWPDRTRPEMWWSPRLFEMLGFEADEFQPTVERCQELLHPDDRAALREAMPNLMGSDEPFELEHRIRTKAGGYVWLQARGRLSRDEAGEHVGVAGSVRDITWRKETEAALRQERDKSTLYLETAEVIMVALDAQGHVEMINRAGCEILGRSREELLGADWFSVALPAGVGEEVRRVFQATLAGEVEPPVSFENTVVSSAGVERLVAWHNAFLRDEGGTPVGVLSSGTDITDLRDSQQALAASEARLRSLYGSVQAGVLVQSASGAILHANDVAAEIFGMSPDQVSGRTSFDPAWEMTDEEGNPVTGEDHPSMITLRTGQPVRNAVRGIFSGDPARTRWVLINTEPRFEAGRDGVAEVVITFLDITERRQAEEALRESRNRAQLYLDIADVMLLALDREGRIEMINRRGCEILDTSPEDLLGVDWFATCLPPAETPQVREIFAALMAGRLPDAERVENLVRTRTGELRRVAWHNSILRDEGGQILGVFSSGEDVTELRKSEAALQDALAWQEAIIEGSADAIFISDEESRFVMVNGAAVELTGYPEEELLTMTIPDLHQEVHRAAYEAYHDRIMGGEQALTEAVILRSDGTKVEAEFNNRLLVIGGRAYMHTVARDLTERRTIELALRGTQERLSLAQEVAGIGFMYREASSGIEFWSPRTFELLGLDRSQTAAGWDAFLSVLSPEDREVFLRRLEKVQRGEAVPPTTFSVVHPTGEVRRLAERISSFGGEGTSPRQIISVLRDVTEEEVASVLRELHAQRLQASEERFDLAQRVGRVGLLDRNLETGEEVWSDTTFEILGLDPARTTPGPAAWMEAIHPDDRARAIRSLDRLVHGEDSPTEEYRVIHPTGAVRWITRTARAFPSREGKFPGRILATVHDITDLRRAQAALLVSEERFRGVFEKSPLGIALRSPEGGLTAVNPEFCRMLGYEREELLGRDPSTLTHPADLEPSVELTRRMFLGEIPGFTVEKRYVRKSGEPVWCRLVATPVRDESGVVRHGLGLLQDITAERGAAEELRTSAERLRALAARLVNVREEERAALARELHDELGQALTGMRMDLALLRSGPPGARTDLAERISSLIESADAGVEMVRSISSRLRPPILDIMGLGPALEWQVDEHRPRTTTRFHVDVAGCPERLATAHATAVFRIAQEALVNVLRHSEAENASVTVTEEEGFLILTVRDDGAGMPHDGFFAPSSLGLLGMRERALSLGGEVTVESWPEGGTVVRARFPLMVEDGTRRR